MRKRRRIIRKEGKKKGRKDGQPMRLYLPRK